MSEISLDRAERLHRLIGEASCAFGLRARYLGALAFRIREGLEPATRSGVWEIVRPDSAALLDEGGPEPAGEELFRILLAMEGAVDSAERWQVEVDDVVVQLAVRDAERAGRPLLEAFKARLGAV